jgi:hypothetical protein
MAAGPPFSAGVLGHVIIWMVLEVLLVGGGLNPLLESLWRSWGCWMFIVELLYPGGGIPQVGSIIIGLVRVPSRPANLIL